MKMNKIIVNVIKNSIDFKKTIIDFLDFIEILTNKYIKYRKGGSIMDELKRFLASIDVDYQEELENMNVTKVILNKMKEE